ncbi:N-acetylglucosamine kinase [Laspinema olomoucense]|uniref:N-acetylglucosamine kinase n=1 Tax=Laspinema olomoucense TaxID=3231600 RepID=UPI0021BAE566|nr:MULTISPECIES: BadF/BadG/BcrA/BcrD ATPase family protein [unclassified Laspinema]MCT7971378.1 ATPase [Laspinema sp. D3d]MCT7992185.1 ATPase [Laspinema sp. D3c]
MSDWVRDSEFNDSTDWVLGIDGGGTKTVCLVMDETGTIAGRGEAGPSNYQTIGLAAAGESISQAIALAVKNLPGVAIAGIGVGLAGVGRPADVQVVQGLVTGLYQESPLPICWKLHSEGVVVTHDCAIALVGGTRSASGVAIVAGTGSIAYGCNPQGESKRAGGWGYRFGDEGSGYQIAIAGLKAAARSHDGRGPKTLLPDFFLNYLNLNQLEDLIEVIYRRGWGVTEIAALSPLVDRAAAAGDAIAIQILDDAAAELALMTETVASALFTPDQAFEVVTIGGVWRSVCHLGDRMGESLRRQFPAVQVISPRHEPAYGAGLLALERLGKGVLSR